MKNKRIRGVLFPIITAIIWGAAFSAQSVGAGSVEPFTFNTARSVIAVAALSLLFLVTRFVGKKNGTYIPLNADKKSLRNLICGGIICGCLLALATYLQQTGLETVDSGKAGFITALYIVLVPLASFIVFRKKVELRIVISVLIAVAGLYLLCIKDGFTIATGDLYVLACAFVFTAHILTIDHFVKDINGIALSLVQFITMTVVSGICMLLFEHPQWSAITGCMGSILYLGIMSSGIAYTLQMLAQKDGDPTVVSLLMSLESVFSVISGAIFLHERMEPRSYIGCAVMFCAVILTQIPIGNKKNNV